MMNRSCRQIASWHLIAVGVSMKISRDDKPEKNPLFFLKLTSPKTARKFSFRNIYRNINFWLPTLINKKKGIVKIQQTVTLQTSIPIAAWVNQTSCHRVSEIDFVNEVTNERKSIIPPAWIHQATHQYPSQVLTYAHWRSMAGCLEARVGGPGRTRTCNNTVMSRGF